MTTRIALILLSLCMIGIAAESRTRTTQSHLQSQNVQVPVTADTISASASEEGFSQQDISIKGYNKRASDRKETFFVTNNTSHRISHVKIRFRYKTSLGEPLHEQEHSVAVNLAPGETKQVSVTSWDTLRQFYYQYGPKPRKSATPFVVTYRLLGYDIPVGK